jgi:hypothetical protein
VRRLEDMSSGLAQENDTGLEKRTIDFEWSIRTHDIVLAVVMVPYLDCLRKCIAKQMSISYLVLANLPR